MNHDTFVISLDNLTLRLDRPTIPLLDLDDLTEMGKRMVAEKKKAAKKAPKKVAKKRKGGK